MNINPALVEDLCAIAAQASAALMPYYGACALRIDQKMDNTPVTQADRVSAQVLSEQLVKCLPIPILSEEDAIPAFSQRQNWEYYWCVDPLDGTKEFIHQTHEFTINIALIHKGNPIAGVIYVPCEQTAYWALQGHGAWRAPDGLRLKGAKPTEPARCLVSRRHTNPERYADFSLIRCGSALKFARLAEGKADFYPRRGPTSEWDTAAGQILLECAGGQLIDWSGVPLQYNQKESLINPPFLAVADGQTSWLKKLEKYSR